MATNQGDRQASVRAVTGTSYTYEGDWHALFDLAGVPAGDFNGRLLSWINLRLNSNYATVSDAMAAFAIAQGASSWSGLGSFLANPIGKLNGRVLNANAGPRGGLAAALRGAITPNATISGLMSVKKALIGSIVGGATFTSNLSGGPGQLRGAVPHAATIAGGLAASLKASVSGAATIAGTLNKLKALVGNVPGGATFTSALTGAGGAMPAGASGIWYAKDYDSTNKAAPNTVTVGSTPISANILRMSTDGLNVLANGYYAVSNVTATDNYADGPTGAPLSSTRLVGTGNCAFRTAFNLPSSGSYVLCFDVKSNTGSNQSFKSIWNLAQGSSVTNTATTSWQRMVIPMTLTGAAVVYIATSPDGTTGWDLLIDNIQVFAGSSDLGRETLAGHIYFDLTAKETLTTNPATGVLNLASNGSGIARFPSNITLTNGFTCGAMVKRVGTGAGYPAIFSKPESYGGFSAFTSNPINNLNGNLGGTNAGANGVWDSNGVGWHMVTHRYDPVSGYYDIFYDDARILHKAITPSATTAKNLMVGAVNGFAESSSLGTNHHFNSWFLYPSALTTAQIQGLVYPALKTRLTTDGQTHTRGRVVCAEGDSITADGSSYYIQSAGSLNGQGVNYAVSGSTLSNINSRWTGGINGLIPSGSTGVYIMSLLDGANDLTAYGGSTNAQLAASFLTQLYAYTDMIRAAGWKVLLCTILPKNDTTYNGVRAIVNADIRTSVGTHCDGVCDFDTDAQMGIDSSFTTYPANWTDGTHPNATGHARLAPIWYAAANAIT